MIFTMRVEGDPVAQPRPRTFQQRRRDGGTFITTMSHSDRSRGWMKQIKAHFMLVHSPAEVPIFAEGWLRMTMIFYMPKGRTVKRDHPTTKPDASNLAKLVEDALNGLVYKDDSQLCVVYVEKRYEDAQTPPGVLIEVNDLESETPIERDG